MSFFGKTRIIGPDGDSQIIDPSGDAHVAMLNEREIMIAILQEIRKLVFIMQEETGIELDNDTLEGDENDY